MTDRKRGPLLEALREATSSQHRAVEALLPPSWSTLGREGYRSYLERMAGFHLPLEERVFAGHDWTSLGLPAAAERPRAALLRADLAALGLDANGLSRATDLPDVRDLGRALGVLYVLEGSTLGGQVLAREVIRGAPGVPTTFLRGAGDAGARWRSFVGFAESLVAGRAALSAQAVDGAVEAFASLVTWLRA